MIPYNLAIFQSSYDPKMAALSFRGRDIPLSLFGYILREEICSDSNMFNMHRFNRIVPRKLLTNNTSLQILNLFFPHQSSINLRDIFFYSIFQIFYEIPQFKTHERLNLFEKD